MEIEGSDRLLAACVTAASEGMRVHTETPQLREIRRTVIELLFTEGNHVCAVCVANGHCELQNLAVEVGMDHSRLPYRFPQRQVDLSHAQFGLDHNRCILCTRCVRVCDEVEGAHVWDVGWRGEHCQIISGLNEPWGEVSACTHCGKCVDVCPTGALFHKPTAAKKSKATPSGCRPWSKRVATSNGIHEPHPLAQTTPRHCLARGLLGLSHVVPGPR